MCAKSVGFVATIPVTFRRRASRELSAIELSHFNTVTAGHPGRDR
jgi:hypothetical protein